MIVLRPNGLVERLQDGRRPVSQMPTYGRTQPGAQTPEAIAEAARRDRRRQRRGQADPLRGRLLDLST